MEINKVNSERIKLARESRGMSQTYLAKKMKTASQVLLSKIEKGLANVTNEVLEELSSVLDYPKSFFYLRDDILPLKHFYFRKNLTNSQNKLKSLEAEINIINGNISTLLESFEIEKNIPFADLEKFNNSPKLLASRVREKLNIARGPINDIVKTVEKLGIIIHFHNFKTDIKISGVSVIGSNGVPIMIINKNMPNSRKTFTIAHELGHILMHFMFDVINADRDVEKEADLFASSFLIPDNEIKGELFNITEDKLFDLKMYWKVSAQALLFKAKLLGTISLDQYRRWVTKFNYLGWRMKEPCEFNISEPLLLGEMFRIHFEEFGFEKNDIVEIFGLYKADIDEYYFKSYEKLNKYLEKDNSKKIRILRIVN